jgi:hypothetical protein
VGLQRQSKFHGQAETVTVGISEAAGLDHLATTISNIYRAIASHQKPLAEENNCSKEMPNGGPLAVSTSVFCRHDSHEQPNFNKNNARDTILSTFVSETHSFEKRRPCTTLHDLHDLEEFVSSLRRALLRRRREEGRTVKGGDCGWKVNTIQDDFDF